MAEIPRPLPPQPANGRPCALHQDATATGWRWYRTLGTWEPVCKGDGGRRLLQAGDYVPDWANVDRTPKDDDHE